MSTTSVQNLQSVEKPKGGPPAKKSKQALLRVHIPGEESGTIHPGVIDGTDWDELSEHCRQCHGVAILEVYNLAVWPDEARSMLLATIRDLDGKARLRSSRPDVRGSVRGGARVYAGEAAGGPPDDLPCRERSGGHLLQWCAGGSGQADQ